MENASKKIKEREKVLKDFISRSEHGLYSLRKNRFFIDYIENKGSLKELQEVFLTFSKAHNIFMQLRYIDKEGFEKIRVDRNSINETPFLIQEQDLQNKYFRYYFSDSKSKEMEKVWFSALDLNMEKGAVQVPYNPTLRAILPVENQGKFGGIIIINYFMESFLDKFLNISLYDSILYDNKGYILKHFDAKYDWSFYNIGKKVKIQDLLEDTNSKQLLGTTLFRGDTYVANILDIPIANKLHLFLKLKDTYIQAERIKQFKQYFLVATTTFIFSLIIAVFIARNFHRVLNELEDKSKELEAKNKNLKQFVDTQDNIVILTDGKEASFANKRFFKFLGYDSLEAFKKKHNCICEFFIENDRFFHLGKISKEENWVEVLQTLPHSQRIVSMMGDDFQLHAFSIAINRFDKTTLIVSFTDISQTMLEHIKLEEKTIHDKLTGAYNREYFEKHYKRLLDEYTQDDFQFALAVLDIDHFKLVNDNFGHDVGDYVLKHFVKTIQQFSRSYDILIRWGGEEFIMLFRVKSEDDLHKVLEHLRKVIELVEFDTIGHKTCSIGGTIYKDGEDIETTIKRADEAVYEAKAAGRNQVVIY